MRVGRRSRSVVVLAVCVVLAPSMASAQAAGELAEPSPAPLPVWFNTPPTLREPEPEVVRPRSVEARYVDALAGSWAASGILVLGVGAAGALTMAAACGVHGAGVVTALTVQDTAKVKRVLPVFPNVVREQLQTLAGTKDLQGVIDSQSQYISDINGKVIENAKKMS